MEFEWDDNKAQKNLLKHYIAFEDVTAVFYDPLRLTFDVTRLKDGEQRSKVIGKMNDTVIVTVVCTDREGRVRIISARKAGKNERDYYNNQS
jgi:uncharacterized protein